MSCRHGVKGCVAVQEPRYVVSSTYQTVLTGLLFAFTHLVIITKLLMIINKKSHWVTCLCIDDKTYNIVARSILRYLLNIYCDVLIFTLQASPSSNALIQCYISIGKKCIWISPKRDMDGGEEACWARKFNNSSVVAAEQINKKKTAYESSSSLKSVVWQYYRVPHCT